MTYHNFDSSPLSFAYRAIGNTGAQSGMRPSYMPAFEADDGAGSGGNDSGDQDKSDKTEKEKTVKDKAADKPNDAVLEAARLARDLAKKDSKLTETVAELAAIKEQLSRFKDIDPEQVKDLMRERAEAEEARKKAEEDKLRAAGDFDALRKRMAEENAKLVDEERNRAKALENQIAKLNSEMRSITIGSAFQSSTFLRESTVLPPSKALRAYDDHFEIKDGQIHAYDRPISDPKREPLVDSSGRPLSFEEAIKLIVEADPDRDHILKSQQKPGSGVAPSAGAKSGSKDESGVDLNGQNRIAAALKAMKARR